jgi:hypothetical protein
MNLLQYAVAASVVEALWETTKMFWQNGKFNYDKVGAVAFGELIAIGSNIDFLDAVGLPMYIPYVGKILTGLLISRGANFMHDLLGNLNNIQQKTKTK